ncbi:protein enabled isoform X1 [Serinus canaria]|uniref:protein enabled isoform X1 n=1 Tax=Serinus canaria TaxID=9135 RepID=UPI0021CD18C2|nr:protein enabled isoform X1 [Serinus canaria]
MAPGLVLNLLLFLLFLLFATPARAEEAPPSEVSGAVGGVALLNPRGPQNPSEFSQIHWRWQNQLRIAGRQRGEQPQYPPSRFGGRLELLANGTLRMSPLSLGDSGEYRLYLEDDTGRESVQRVLLRVYGGHLRVDPAPEGGEEGGPRPGGLHQPRGGNLRLQGQQPRVLQLRLADLPAPLHLDRGILLGRLPRHAQRPGGPGTPPPPPPPPPAAHRGLRTSRVAPPVTSSPSGTNIWTEIPKSSGRSKAAGATSPGAFGLGLTGKFSPKIIPKIRGETPSEPFPPGILGDPPGFGVAWKGRAFGEGGPGVGFGFPRCFSAH